MKTKVNMIEIISHDNSPVYTVGFHYNGLLLDRIEDWSKEFPDSLESIYIGFTKDDERVFEIINAPIHVTYIENK